ncbi:MULTISPECIES: sugar phosphate isomerase/epimerase family protein [Brachybacterium]|uniref:Sugar phosphate isomerase n=1 Tax=Brachybacterium alimentarium TaxID=47845 RepID=A0A2A3YIZ1_9MICO|nr:MULTISPECIES: TIM barrel protein [Brachybacterium]PCC39251.1 sugar phosphate isomerase [Brachybacterium alimentarium]RCS64357.1 sugar phosphate isomerase/epimerase [Brachybacterium sp. JB7]RCS89175.1 sugar phosphate isomerase/epimerase [Brachybacterium alimentarium]
MARIGIQLMMLKEHVAQDGILPVLRRVKDTGFEVVEVSQIPMTEENVAGMEAARDELGIHFAAISAKTSAPEDSDELTLAKHFDLHVEHARRLGTKHLRIGMMPLSAMASQEAFDAFAAEADGYARRMADAGLRLSYHNHHVEFAKLGGVTLLDQLRQKAPHLRYEIDCHWVQRGGRDPERTLADFDGVLDLVHLKDYRITLPPAEVLAAAAGGDRSAFTRFWGGEIVQFAEVGQGTLDWKPVIEQALASGAQHLLIEQDQTYGRDIFDALTMSREHLVSLGFGALITG